MKDLEFTGERIIPGKVDEALWYEHMARYIFAANFVKDKNVLDAGCGSGYGADFLASRGAKYVLGVDISSEAIAYAQEHYRRNNLEYLVMDVTNLRLDDKSFDVIVAFEVIEHLHDQEKFLAEVRRVLKDDGLLIISTPNREVYRLGLEANPFHTKEFNFEEFYQLLSRYFCSVKIFAQSYFAGIFITSIFDGWQRSEKVILDSSLLKKKPEPLYFVALCSQTELGEKMRAHKLIPFSYDRDEYLGKLQAEFEDKLTWALRLNKEVGRLSEELVRREERLLALQEEVRKKEENIAHLQKELNSWHAEVQRLSEELVRREERLLALLSELRNSLLWPKMSKILCKPLWPFIALYRVSRPFWKLRRPLEQRFRRALVVGSASKDIMFKVIDSLVRRFPEVQFMALVPDNWQKELRTKWPQLEVEAINRAEYRVNPLRILIKLWRGNFDFAVVVLSGEKGYYKHKFVGFLSGARYLMVYNENIDSFYWMLGCFSTIMQHLSWRMRLGQLHLNLKYWVSYPLSVIGYLIIFVKVLPLLVRVVLRRSSEVLPSFNDDKGEGR